MFNKKIILRLWAKSLGEKGSSCNSESDKIATVRTIIFLTYLITNIFIISGVARHWNDVPSQQKCEITNK